MVIFNSYVSLPEGNIRLYYLELHCSLKRSLNNSFDWWGPIVAHALDGLSVGSCEHNKADGFVYIYMHIIIDTYVYIHAIYIYIHMYVLVLSWDNDLNSNRPRKGCGPHEFTWNNRRPIFGSNPQVMLDMDIRWYTYVNTIYICIIIYIWCIYIYDVYIYIYMMYITTYIYDVYNYIYIYDVCIYIYICMYIYMWCLT